MINLNECKFGDKLRTESGKMVLFICKQQPVNFYPFSKDDNAIETFTCISESDNGGFVYMDYVSDGRNFDVRVPKICPENEIVGLWEERNNTDEYIFGNKFITNEGKMSVFIAKLSNSFTENVLKYAFVMPYNNSFALLLLEEKDLHDKNNPNSIVGKWEDEK